MEDGKRVIVLYDLNSNKEVKKNKNVTQLMYVNSV